MLDSIKQKLEQINLIEVTKYKKAGVLILLLNDIETNKIQILYTKRSSKLSTHSGEVSFPGGMWEEEDASLLDTAMSCLLYTSPSPRDVSRSRMPSSA